MHAVIFFMSSSYQHWSVMLNRKTLNGLSGASALLPEIAEPVSEKSQIRPVIQLLLDVV